MAQAAFPSSTWKIPKEVPGENLESAWSRLQDVKQRPTVPRDVKVWGHQKVPRPQSAPCRRVQQESELSKNPSPSTSKKRPTTADRFRGAKSPVEQGHLQRSETRNTLLSEDTYHGTIDLIGRQSSDLASVTFQPEGSTGQELVPAPRWQPHRLQPRSRPSSAPSLRRAQTPTQLGAAEVQQWMSSTQLPYRARKDANSVVTYKSSAHSPSTKRYVVRTDVPKEVPCQPAPTRANRQSGNFAMWLWQVVTKPAEPIAEETKPVSQRERAKNIRRNSKVGMRQVEVPARHEVQLWQEEVKAKSRPSSALSRGTIRGSPLAYDASEHRGFTSSVEGKQLALEAGPGQRPLSRSSSKPSVRPSRPMSAST